MAQAFNLTAQINLRGPSNIGTVVSDIRKRLGSINASVNLNINPATTQNVARLSAALNNLNTSFGTTSVAANRAASAINNFGNSINAIQIRNLPQQINNTNSALTNLNTNSVATTRAMTNATNQMSDFGRQSALAVRRFAAFSLATGAIYGLSNAINQGIKSYIDYNKEIVRLQQVTGESAKGLKALENQISSLATSFGVSSTELTTISLTLAQAGLSARDTEKALKALALSSLAPSFDSMNETVEGSIALMRQFGISAGDLEKALGSINAVAAKFAVEASDIITAIQRTGGVFATASKGVSEGTDALNEFISVFTSVRATTRESSETIATGLRTIFTRIQRGGTIEALKEYGVNLQDLDGKFVGAYKAVELLSKGLNKIDPRELKFSRIVEELGGFRQIGKVIPLIQQFSTAQEALKVAQGGQSSLAKDAATAQLSLANQISKVREEFLALFREIGSSTSFQVMIKNALSLASAMIRIADSMKEVLPVLGTILAFRGANALVQYGAGFAGAIRGGASGRRAVGGAVGYNGGGTVNALLTPGEAVIEPKLAKRIGRSNLDRMNHADKIIKRNKGGGVRFVPGVGDGDTFGPIPLEEGSYVIRKKAVEAIGTDRLSQIGRYAKGGPVGVTKAAKYATGGVINIESSKPYVKNIPTTYNKAPGDSIYKAVLSDPKLVLSKNDKIEAQITRKPIFIKDLVSSRDKLFKEYQIASDARRGIIFEDMLLKSGKISKKADRPTSRLDAAFKNTLVEIKSTKEPVSTLSLLDKVAGAIFRPRSNIDKIASDKASSISMSSKPDTMSIGQLLVYEDATRLRSAKDNSNTQTQIEKLAKKRAYSGGFIEKFMSGSFVSNPGRRKVAKTLGIRAGTDDYTLLGKKENNLSEDEKIRKQQLISDYNQKITTAIAEKEEALSAAPSFGLAGLRGKARRESGITTKGLVGTEVTMEKGVMSASTSRRIEAIIRKEFRATVSKVASIIASQAGTDTVKDKKQLNTILQKAGLSNVTGAALEAAIAAAGAPYSGKRKTGDPIDFPQGLGPVASVFGIPSDIPTDVTRTVGGKGKYNSRFLGQVGRYLRKVANGGFIQRFSQGRFANAPLIDDIVGNAPNTMLPIPTGSRLTPAIQKLIEAGGGAIDYDGTIEKHVGDEAFARAKTDAEREAVLQKYYRGNANRRLGARPTKFAKDLQKAIQQGLLKPTNLTVISKSKRLPVVEDQIFSMLGIPRANMIFTQGGSKIAALEAFRTKGPRVNRVSRANGGEISKFNAGGNVQFNGVLYPLSELERVAGQLGMSPQALREIIDTRVDKDKVLGGRHSDEATRLLKQFPMKLNIDSAAKRAADARLSKQMAREDQYAQPREYERRYTPDDYSFGKKLRRKLGGEIPIMAQEGEYVIQRSAAQRIGYHNLDRLNKYHTGGKVQKLNVGGPPIPAARPDVGASTYTQAYGLVGVTPQVTQQLSDLARILTELGVTSSATGAIIQRGYQVSYSSATRAYEADIRRARIAGASAEQIAAAENQLRTVRETAQRDVTTRRTLGGLSGQQLQSIEFNAQSERQRIRETTRARLLSRGMAAEDVESRLQQNAGAIDRLAYTRASNRAGINLRGAGLRGDDAQNYISQSMRDRNTLAQMDRAYIPQRAAQIRQQLAAEQGVTGDRVAMRRLSRESVRMAQEEARDRRRIINEIARSQGMAGPGNAGFFGNIAAGARNAGNRALNTSVGRAASFVGGGLANNAGFFLPMAIASLGSAGAPIARGMTSDPVSQARKQARVENATSTLGTGLGIAGGLAMVGGPLGMAAAGVVAFGTVLYATADVITDFSGAAKKAGEEFAASLRAKNIEDAGETLAMSFRKLEKDTNNIDLQQRAIGNIKNLLSPLNTNAQQNLRLAAEAKESEGRTYTQYFMGSKQTLSGVDIMSAAQKTAKQYEGGADAASKIIELELKRGIKPENIDKSLQEIILRSDPEVLAEIFRRIQKQITSQGNITEKEKQRQTRAIEQEILSRRINAGEATNLIKKNVDLQKAMEEAEKATVSLAQNFEKFVTSLNQATQSSSFFGERLSQGFRSNLAAGSGQAGQNDNISFSEINTLRNPMAATIGEFETAVENVLRPLGDTNQTRAIRGNLLFNRSSSTTFENAVRERASVRRGSSNDINIEKLAPIGQTAVNELLDRLFPKNEAATAKSKLDSQLKRIIDEVTKIEDQTPQQKQEELIKRVNDVLKNLIPGLDEAAIGFAQFRENALNRFSSDLSEAGKKLKLAAEYAIKARNIGIESFFDIRRATTGVGPSVNEVTIQRNQRIRDLTGGNNGPTAIRQNIEALMANRKALKEQQESTIANSNEFTKLDIEIQNIDRKLNDANSALDDFANNTEVASAALEQIVKIQQLEKEQADQAFGIATASPEENMRKMLARQRLTNILSGRPEVNQPSRETRVAYSETFRQTGDFRQARLAAENVRAQQRAETKQELEDYKGRIRLEYAQRQQMVDAGVDRQAGGKATAEQREEARRRAGVSDSQVESKLREMEARVLKQFGTEMNMSFGNIPNMIRNPLGGAAGQQAIGTYDEARRQQQQANLEQKTLYQNIARLPDVLENLNRTLQEFINRNQIAQVNTGVVNAQVQKPVDPRMVPPRPEGLPPGFVPPWQQPQRRAKGGVIYASAGGTGTLVNYEPKGKDTIPAMLANGEFVINDESTRKYRRALEAINNKRPVDEVMSNLASMQPVYASTGGVVYLEGGGPPEEQAKNKRATRRIIGYKNISLGKDGSTRVPVYAPLTEEERKEVYASNREILRQKAPTPEKDLKQYTDYVKGEEFWTQEERRTGIDRKSKFYQSLDYRTSAARTYASENNFDDDRADALVDTIRKQYRDEQEARKKAERPVAKPAKPDINAELRAKGLAAAAAREAERRKNVEDAAKKYNISTTDASAYVNLSDDAISRVYDIKDVPKGKTAKDIFLERAQERAARLAQTREEEIAKKNQEDKILTSILLENRQGPLVDPSRLSSQERTQLLDQFRDTQRFNENEKEKIRLSGAYDLNEQQLSYVMREKPEQRDAFAKQLSRSAFEGKIKDYNQQEVINETRARLEDFISQETSFIRQLERDKEASGLFGSFARAVKNVDEFDIFIRDARRKIANARMGLRTIAPDVGDKRLRPYTQQDLDTSRGLAGLPYVDIKTFEPSKADPDMVGSLIRAAEQGRGLARASKDQTLYKSQEEGITASRDIAIDLIAGIAGLGIGGAGVAGGKLALGQAVKAAGLYGLKYGAIGGATTGSVRGYENVKSGRSTVGEAAIGALSEAGLGGIFGGAIGAGSTLIGRGISSFVKPFIEKSREKAARVANERKLARSFIKDTVAEEQSAEQAFKVVQAEMKTRPKMTPKQLQEASDRALENARRKAETVDQARTTKAAKTAETAKAAKEAAETAKKPTQPKPPESTPVNPTTKTPIVDVTLGSIFKKIGNISMRSAYETGAGILGSIRQSASRALKTTRNILNKPFNRTKTRATDTARELTPDEQALKEAMSGNAYPKSGSLSGYGRRVLGGGDPVFAYRGSAGRSIEQGFDLNAMGSTGDVYGRGLYGAFDADAVGSGKAVARGYMDRALQQFIKENPGLTPEQVAAASRSGMLYKLKIKNPELFADANAMIKGTREESIISNIFQNQGLNIDPSTTTTLRAYNTVARKIFRKIQSENPSISQEQAIGLAKSETSRIFASQGIPGMVSYRNNTRVSSGMAKGAGIISIFDPKAFEIANKRKPGVEYVKSAMEKMSSKPKAATKPPVTSPTVATKASPIENEILGFFTRRGTSRYFDNPAALDVRKDLIARGEISGATGYKTRFKPKPGQLEQVKELVAKDPKSASMITQLKTNEDFLVFYGVRGDAVEAAAINARIEKIAGNKLLEGGASEYGDKIKLGKYGSARFDPVGASDTSAKQVRDRILRLITNKEFKAEHPEFSNFASSVFGSHYEDPQTLLYSLGSYIEGLPGNIQKSIYQGVIPEYQIPGYYKGGMVYGNNSALSSALKSGKDDTLVMAQKGEFITNEKSTRANYPILQAINSGHFDRGGIVNYMAKGGIVAPRYFAEGGIGTNNASNSLGVSNNIGMDMEGFSSAINEILANAGDSFKQTVIDAFSTGVQPVNAAATSLSESATKLADTPTQYNVAVNSTMSVNGIPPTLDQFGTNLINSANQESDQKRFRDLKKDERAFT